MILLVTQSSCSHADLLEEALERASSSYLRLNTDLLLDRWAIEASVSNGRPRGRLISEAHEYDLESVSAIWWFGWNPPLAAKRQETPDFAKWIRNETRACFMNVIESLDVHFVNRPSAIDPANNKFIQHRLATQFGLRTPESLVTCVNDSVRRFFDRHKSLVYKTFSHPTVTRNGVEHVVYANELTKPDILKADTIQRSLNLFQEAIQKQTEIRVTVVGDWVFAAEIYSQESERTKTDWRRYHIEKTPHFPVRLPQEVADACLRITQCLQLEYSTIDLIRTPEDRFVFLELNPNGLWSWIEMLTGLPISRTMAQNLSTANKAVESTATAARQP